MYQRTTKTGRNAYSHFSKKNKLTECNISTTPNEGSALTTCARNVSPSDFRPILMDTSNHPARPDIVIIAPKEESTEMVMCDAIKYPRNTNKQLECPYLAVPQPSGLGA